MDRRTIERMEGLVGCPIQFKDLSTATMGKVVDYERMYIGNEGAEGKLRHRLKELESGGDGANVLVLIVIAVAVVGTLGLINTVAADASAGMKCGSLIVVAIISGFGSFMLFERLGGPEKRAARAELDRLMAGKSQLERELKSDIERDLTLVLQQRTRPTVEVSRTVRHISVDMNQLYDQIMRGGMAVPYRCPSCGGTLKLDGGKRFERCPYCESDVDVKILSDLIDALR